MKKNKLIPFHILPGSWGLKGQIYKEAEAAYYLEGEELERELAKIRNEDNPKEYNRQLIEIGYKYKRFSLYEKEINLAEYNYEGVDLEIKKIEIQHKHSKILGIDKDREIAKLKNELTKEKEIEISFKNGIIDEYSKDMSIAKLIEDEQERDLALLEVEFKHGKIKKIAYEKNKATILKEPWVGTIDHGFDSKKGINGFYFEFDWNEYWIEYLQLNGYVGRTDDEIVESWFSDVCNSNIPDDERLMEREE
jgi:hypothetical protein